MDKDSQEYQLLLANRIPVDGSIRPLIYFLFDGDELVYIGQSKHGLTRIPEHIKAKEFTHYTWMNCPVDLLSNTEAYYIVQFKPKYNTSLPRNEVYKTPKEAVKMYGMTMREAREWVTNFEDIPVHEIGGYGYVATHRVGFDGAESDVWFPDDRFTNEEVASEPGFRGEVVDIRRQFQAAPR